MFRHVPNLLTGLRLVLAAGFFAMLGRYQYHATVQTADGLDRSWLNTAFIVYLIALVTDFLDGYLARRWNQVSRVGQLLDPAADRLYILATLVGLTIRHIIPLWLPIVLVGRDVAMLVLISPKLRKAGYGVALPVHFLGKAATFNLLYAFPLVLLGQISEKPNHLTDIANIFGWAFVGWGTALYLLAGGMYFVQARQLTGGSKR